MGVEGLKGQGINLATTYRKGRERPKRDPDTAITGTGKDAEHFIAKRFGDKLNHCNQDTEAFYTASFVPKVPYKKLI